MRWRDEDGQALVLALAFLIFAGLVIAATLTYAYASELSTQRLGEQRNTVYAADGATDAVVQIGRLDATLGAYGDARCHATDPTTGRRYADLPRAPGPRPIPTDRLAVRPPLRYL